MWEIKGKDSVVKASVNGVEFNDEWMAETYVSVTIESPYPIDFSIGDYLIYRGERFEINYDPGKIKSAPRFKKGDAFKYENVKFNSLADELARCDFLDVVPGDNQLHFTGLPKFSFYSNVRRLADRIQANLDRAYGKNTWQVTVSGEFTDTTELNVAVDTIKVSGVLEILVNQFKAYYTIKGRTLTIGAAGVPADHLFKYGKGNGLYEIEQNAEADQQIVTRLRAYGSTRNIPHRYYNSLTDADGVKLIPDNMAVQYLMLPSFPYSTLDPYIDSPNISKLGVREGTIFFDGSNPDLPEIYPSIEGMTAEQLKAAGVQCNATGALDVLVSAEQMTDNGVGVIEGDAFEGNATTTAEPATFKVTLPDIGFDINDHLTTETAKISFKSGMLGAREFEIVKCTKSGNNYVLELNRVYDEDIKLWFPYKDYNAKTGDRYVLLAIKMPEVYIKAAAQRLKEKAEEWLSKNDYSRSVYAPKIDENFMARQHDAAMASNGAIKSLHDTLCAGMQLLFEDEDLGIDAAIFIDRLTIKEEADKIPTYEVVLKEEKTVGRLDKMQNQIDSLVSSQGQGGYNASQIRSLITAYGGGLFLSKLKNDRTPYMLSSDTGFEVGDFLAGVSGGRFAIDKETGHSYAELDRLYVRVRAYFESLTIIERESLAGEQQVTPGGGVKCTSVDEVRDADGNLTGWRCYFLSEQDGEKRETKIIAGDQAIAQTWNAGTGTSSKVSNKRWWRLVTAVSNDAYADASGNRYGYIEVSKTDCETGSDIPEAGDEIVQFGSRTDATRQAAIVISTVSSDAPSMKLFTGIGSGTTNAEHYSLSGRDIISYGYDHAKGRAYMRCYGDLWLGDKDGTSYVKYDSAAKKWLLHNVSLSVSSTIGDKTIEDYVKSIVPPVTQEDITQFVNNIVGPDLNAIKNQIDGVVETWWGEGAPTMGNYPANQWTTDAEKEKHLSDLYCDNDTGFAYRFSKAPDGTYFWNDKVDTATAKALTDAAKAQDTADKKRRVFVAQPVPPYDQGDIWVNATYGTQYSNDILRCVTPKTAAQPFAISDWTLASKYTDDSALNTFISEYEDTIADIKTQADLKAETWYQPTDPSAAWDTADKAKHKGDLWYCTADIANTNFKKGTTWYWGGAAWEKQDVPESVFDAIDGKADIFVSKPTAGYHVNDLWFLEADYTLSGTAYKAGTLVVAKNNMGAAWSADDWIKKDRYTDATDIANALKDYEYLTEALKDVTTIQGGLMMTGLVRLGQYNSDITQQVVWAGINGVRTNDKSIAAWYGGDMLDKENGGTGRTAKSLFRMDGSGYLADGNITWNAMGAIRFGSGIVIDLGGGNTDTLGGLSNTLANNINLLNNVLNCFEPQDSGNNPVGWDSPNIDRIKVKKNFYSMGFVSAKGMNPDGTIAAGGLDITRLKAYLDGSDPLNTEGAYATQNWVLGKNYLTSAALTGYATEQWVADKGYATQNWVTGKGYLTGITKSQVEAVLTGNITSHTHSQYLTSHQPLDHLNVIDSRGTATLPNSWSASFRLAFKRNSTNGLNDGDGYNGELFFKPYGNTSDFTGGYPHQLGFTTNGNIWHRIGRSATSWSAWKKLAFTTDIPTSLKSPYALTFGTKTYDGSAAKTITAADLGALTSHQDISGKVDKVDGKGLSSNDFTDALLTKLNGIAAGANNYTLPTASTSVKGGVKVGGGLSISSDVLSVNLAASHIPSLPISKITDLQTALNGKVAKSGDTMTGNLKLPTIIISSTEYAQHLAFSRQNWNYITAPTGGVIAFVTNGKGKGDTVADLAIANDEVKPGNRNNAVILGTSSYRWKNVYSVLGNFSGKVTAQSVTIGDCEITWDAENQGLKFSKGIYSMGFVSAKGIDPNGGTSSGGGVSADWLATNGYKTYADTLTGVQSWVNGQGYLTASALSNGSVTKVGTTSVGGTAKPIYLNAGTPTALSATIGSASKPVYLSGGTITACSHDIPTKMSQLSNNLFVVGTQTAATNVWTGNLDGLTAYYNGLTIDYYLPFAGTNTAATLNLNGLGAKTLYNGRKGSVTTHYVAGTIIRMTYYNGAFYADAYYDSNSTYSGFVSAYCNTAAATAAKGASATNFVLTSGVSILVRFTSTNTAKSALTLNVNSQGAKPLYINGAASSASNYTLNAGVYPCYYDGTNWHVYTDGTYRFTNVLASKIAKVGGTSSQFLKADGSVDGNAYALSSALSSYLPLAGGSMTGLLTAKTGATHTGIKLGKTYLSSLSDQVLLQNCDAIRFGGDSWDWNGWAGLKYVHTDKTIYLGLADNTIFNANAAQSGGSLKTPGISNIYIGTSTLVASQTWVSDNYQPKGNYLTSVAWSQVTGKPTIPTNTNQLTNGAGFITSAALSDYVTLGTAQTLQGMKYFQGGSGVHMSVDTSNYENFRFVNVNATSVLGYVGYHNTEGNMFISAKGNNTEPWSDVVGKYQLRLSSAGDFTFNTYPIWHSGNDGSGSGLDADLLDGVHNGDITSRFIRYTNNNSIHSAVGFMQQNEGWNDYDAPGQSWYSVMKLAHGNGDTYYNRTLAFDFFSHNIFTGHMQGGTFGGWKQLATTEHISVAVANCAKLAQENNLVHAGNEITMVPSGFSGGLWFNYRTCGGTNGAISEYCFGTGAGAGNYAGIHCGTIRTSNFGIFKGCTYLGYNAIGFNRNTDTGDIFIPNSNGAQLNFSPNYNGLEIGTHVNGNYGIRMLVKCDSGNVGIGTTSPAYKLDVAGDIGISSRICQRNGGDLLLGNANNFGWVRTQDICSQDSYTYWSIRTSGLAHFKTGVTSDGYITAKTANSSSDARLKDILGNILLDIDTMADAPSVRFKWKDTGEIAAGSIAQYWQPRLPEVVSTNNKGYYTLGYGVLGTLMGKSCAVHLRRHEHILLTHESRITRLERENREMRQEINELKRQLLNND